MMWVTEMFPGTKQRPLLCQPLFRHICMFTNHWQLCCNKPWHQILISKWTYYAIITLFWVTTHACLHALMLKAHQFSHTVQCCSTIFSPCLCFFKAPPSWTPSYLIGQLTHAWSSTANNNKIARLNQFKSILGINHAHVWLFDVVGCHKVTEFKARLLTRRAMSSVFRWCRLSPYQLTTQQHTPISCNVETTDWWNE